MKSLVELKDNLIYYLGVRTIFTHNFEHVIIPISRATEHRPGRFLDMISQDPRVFKFNQLHVDIFQFSFIDLKYILHIHL